jgi:hypothetical protein
MFLRLFTMRILVPYGLCALLHLALHIRKGISLHSLATIG